MTKWKTAELIESHDLSPSVKSLRFKVSDWEPHIAGQHYMVRVESPEGYIAERYYSLSNSPLEEGIIELGVQLLPDGEVSTFLHTLPLGGKIKLRGPFGTHFSWVPEDKNSIILIAGGSGLIPFMSMIRLNHEQLRNEQSVPMKIIGSFRTKKDILYYDELLAITKMNPNISFTLTLTQEKSHGWTGRVGRIDAQYLQRELSTERNSDSHFYVSGSTRFVEAMKKQLESIGITNERMKEEQFG